VADNEQSFQERTEQATPKRLEEARKRGQIPRSRELNMAMVMIAASIVFFAVKGQLGGQLVALLHHGLAFDVRLLENPEDMISALGDAALETLAAFAPLLGVLMVAAILGGVSVGGWAVSGKPLEPNFSKLDPIKGLKRVFGLKGLVEVAKALAKAGLIGGAAIGFLAYSAPGILGLGTEPLRATVADSAQLVAMTLLICSLSLAVIAAADVPYQLWNHKKELRMTRKEVQDELKETEGRPEVRSRVRALQQEMANRRMLQDVPKADVVVTNPTHFAVALKYAEGEMAAPVVLAKGADHMAAQIRAIAAEHRVALFEAPPLARALYWTTEVGQQIPGALYLAVAQVLTYVYRLKAAAENRGSWPDRPRVEVDDELASGPRGARRPEE
jgi:flagellar biosynthetic protein FlhB